MTKLETTLSCLNRKSSEVRNAVVLMTDRFIGAEIPIPPVPATNLESEIRIKRKLNDFSKIGTATDTIRTGGLHLRRVALYPVELRVHLSFA